MKNAELKQEYHDLLKTYRHALDQAKNADGEFDLTRVDSIEGDVAAKKAELDRMSARLAELDTKLSEQADLEEKERVQALREAGVEATKEAPAGTNTAASFVQDMSDAVTKGDIALLTANGKEMDSGAEGLV